MPPTPIRAPISYVPSRVPGGSAITPRRHSMRLLLSDADLSTAFLGCLQSRSTKTRCGSAWEILRALCGALTMQQASGLADLDEISVWVSHVAADFHSSIDRRRHELRPFRLPLLVAGLDVRDSQIHEH